MEHNFPSVKRMEQMKDTVNEVYQLWMLYPDRSFGDIIQSMLTYSGKRTPSQIMDAEIPAILNGKYHKA